MAGEDIASGRLVVPFNLPMRLPDSYFLAWDRSALQKPLGQELRVWLVSLAKRQETLLDIETQARVT